MEFSIITLDELGPAAEVVRQAFDAGTPVWIADGNGAIHGLVVTVPHSVRQAFWRLAPGRCGPDTRGGDPAAPAKEG